MCYNDKCTIEISSRIKGEVSIISANGKVSKSEEGMRFDYSLDGDECTLTLKDKEVVQTRRGDQNITMTFRKGEVSECFLESGGFCGEFTVYTHDLQCNDCTLNSGKKAVRLFTLLIAYMLGEDKIELTFSAKI